MFYPSLFVKIFRCLYSYCGEIINLTLSSSTSCKSTELYMKYSYGMAGIGAITGLTNGVDDRGEQDNTSTALQCSSPARSRVVSMSVNTGRLDSDLSITDSLQRPVSDADGGDSQDCVVMTPTTSTQQRQSDRPAPRNAFRSQLRTSITVRLPLAICATCSMSCTVGMSTSHTAASATKTSGDYRRQGGGSLSTSVVWNVDELIPKASLGVRKFRPAPVPYSRPLLKILHQSAADFFDSVRSGHPSSDRRISDGSDWKVKITRLYDEHGYQFSSLYKPAARARISTVNAVTVDGWSTSRSTRTRNTSTSNATQMRKQRSGLKMSTARSEAASCEGSSTTVDGGASVSRKSAISLPAVNSVRKSICRTVIGRGTSKTTR